MSIYQIFSEGILMNRRFTADLEQKLQDSEFKKQFGSELAKTEVAVALTKARIACDTNQVDLASKLGTSQSYVAKLERGDANPTIGMIGKVLAVLGLRLRVRSEPIIHHITPRVVSYKEGTNYTWDFMWSYGLNIYANTKTKTKQSRVAAGGYR
jgi:transcriptional regulator with XRE-family HTH domain